VSLFHAGHLSDLEMNSSKPSIDRADEAGNEES